MAKKPTLEERREQLTNNIYHDDWDSLWCFRHRNAIRNLLRTEGYEGVESNERI